MDRPLPTGFLRLALTVALALLPVSCEVSEAPRRVIVITLDTTRADHLGRYGYEDATTPNLDRMAREGVPAEWPDWIVPAEPRSAPRDPSPALAERSLRPDHARKHATL